MVVDRVLPLLPGVSSGARGEVVRDASLEELAVEVTVDLAEEVVDTAVETNLERLGLEQTYKVDDRVLLPILGVALDSA